MAVCVRDVSQPRGVGIGAEDRIRTGDLLLGKEMLYQLSHFRSRRRFPRGAGITSECRGPESNWRHQRFQRCALPTELPRRIDYVIGGAWACQGTRRALITLHGIGMTDMDQDARRKQLYGLLGDLPDRDRPISAPADRRGVPPWVRAREASARPERPRRRAYLPDRRPVGARGRDSLRAL